MPRDYSARENGLKAKARRAYALERRDLREPSTPREPASGATSFAVKATDPETRTMIEQFLDRKRRGL